MTKTTWGGCLQAPPQTPPGTSVFKPVTTAPEPDTSVPAPSRGLVSRLTPAAKAFLTKPTQGVVVGSPYEALTMVEIVSIIWWTPMPVVAMTSALEGLVGLEPTFQWSLETSSEASGSC